MTRRIFLSCLTLALAMSCTAGGKATDRPARTSDADDAVTEWRVGSAGGVLASSDGTIRLTLGPDEAADGTTVQIHQSMDPMLPETHLSVLASFDIGPTSGRMTTGSVAVHYDPAKVLAGTESGLMMLLQDSSGRWQLLDATIDARAATVTARWPHFSHAVLSYVAPVFQKIGNGVGGGVVDIGRWLRDHVVTFQLGPKKPADCNKKDDGWRKDAGWAFTSTNAEGGRMVVAPLDGCAAAAGGDAQHHVEVTNRYWYAFSAPLPSGASLSFDDLIAHTELPDFIIAAFEHTVSNRVLIPGHSRAHLTVKTSPAGQTMAFRASADIASLILSLVITAIDVASLGTAKEARAAATGLENALWAERARRGSTLDTAEIAEKMADPRWVTENSKKYRPADVPESLFLRFFDHFELYNCVYGASKAQYEAIADSAGDTTFTDAVGKLANLTWTTLNECKKALAKAYLGFAFRVANPDERERMAQRAVLAMLDLKPAAAVNEAAWAGWASTTGRDYTHALLTARQARDPRYDAFAGFNWGRWLRPQASCIEPSNEPWNVYSATLETRQDVTGDGYADYFVWGECPSSTSAWPLILYVIDGASDPAHPRLIGLLGDADYVRSAKATITGAGKNATVTLVASALTPRAPLCCPDVRLTLRYRWNGTSLAEIGRQQKPA